MIPLEMKFVQTIHRIAVRYRILNNVIKRQTAHGKAAYQFRLNMYWRFLHFNYHRY